MKHTYTFSILRYIHDVVTGEFVNIGIVVYSSDARYINGYFLNRYKRISHLFAGFDHNHYRAVISKIESHIEELHRQYDAALSFASLPSSIGFALSSILPYDNSSFQFVEGGVGLSTNLHQTLEQLFRRYVNQYISPHQEKGRSDDDVWRFFKKSLQSHNIINYLRPHKIFSPNYEVNFEHAWKNDIWHLHQPISLDLSKPSSITEKAVLWSGKIYNLSESKEEFKIYFLLGAPSEGHLAKSFSDAKNILHKIPVEHEFIEEDEASTFAEELKKKIETHNKNQS